MKSYEERRQTVFAYMQANMPRLRYSVSRMYAETNVTAQQAADAVKPGADSSHEMHLWMIERWLAKWSREEIRDQEAHPGYYEHLVTAFVED